MLRHLFVILREKYPKLEIGHYRKHSFIIICDQDQGWILSVFDNHIKHKRQQDMVITAANINDPDYFQTIDELIQSIIL